MNKLFLFFFLFPFLSFSQGQKELILYYENGNIRSIKRNIDSNIVEIINYSIYGVMMDSIRFKDEQPIGGIARYQDSGRLKGTVRSIDSNTVEFITYSPNGLLLDSIVQKNKVPFGVRNKYYENGIVKEHARYLDSNLIQVNQYESNGKLKDSLYVKDRVTSGFGYRYYKNGNLKYFIDYKNLEYLEFITYRSNGMIKNSGAKYNNKLFGICKVYNKKGEVIRSQDMFKGEITTVPHKYRKGKHILSSNLKSRFTNKTACLMNNSQIKKLKPGASVSLKLKSDSIVRHHYIIEGFSQDSILLSCFNYNFSENKRQLKFDSIYIVGIKEIDTMYVAKNHYNSAHNVAMLFTITGVTLFIDPLILIPMLGSLATFANPLIIGYLVSGPPIYMWGRHLHKMNVPIPYNLTQWNLRVIKE